MDDTADRAQRARETCPFLTAKQTAFHLGLSPSTMKGMRAEGRPWRRRLRTAPMKHGSGVLPR